MLTSLTKNKIVSEFNLTQNALYRPIHYRPKFYSEFEKYNSLYNNQHNNKHIFLSPQKGVHYPTLTQISPSNYAKRKNENTLNLVEKIKEEKMDILINKIYDKANNIREYNYDSKNKNSFKNLDPIYKKQMKMNLSNKFLKLYEQTKFKGNNELRLNRDFWSQKILDNKKNNEYKKMYCIKFIKNSDKDIIKCNNKEQSVDFKKIVYKYLIKQKFNRNYNLGLKTKYINNINIFCEKSDNKNNKPGFKSVKNNK